MGIVMVVIVMVEIVMVEIVGMWDSKGNLQLLGIENWQKCNALQN